MAFSCLNFACLSVCIDLLYFEYIAKYEEEKTVNTENTIMLVCVHEN